MAQNVKIAGASYSDVPGVQLPLASGSGSALFLDSIGYRTASAQDAIDNLKANSSDLATVATSGSFSDLSNKPTYDLGDLADFSAESNVTVSSVVYHTYWKIAPTSSNQVYGIALHPTNGMMYRVYNNKGTYSVTAMYADGNTQLRTYMPTSGNVELPFALLSTGSTTSAWIDPSSGSYKSAYGAIPMSGKPKATMNPSTGKVTFNGEVVVQTPANSANPATKAYVDTAVSGITASVLYTATIATGWSGSAAPYSKAVTITGILSTDTPIIDVVPSSTYATAQNQLDAWSHVYRAVVAANTITFYADEMPTVAIPIKVLCIRR